MNNSCHPVPRRKARFGFAAVLAISGFVSLLPAQPIVGTDLINLGAKPNNTPSVAYGVNDSGQVTGQSGNTAFLYSNGAVTDLGTLPGGIASEGFSINASGQIAGRSLVNDPGRGIPVWHAFEYSNGSMNDLGILPGGTSFSSSAARGINDLGQIVGDSAVINAQHPVLFSGGQITDLSTYGPAFLNPASAYGINNTGDIVGANFGYNSFLISNGTITYFGGAGSQAEDINNLGQVVGFNTVQNTRQAFIYENGQLTNLPTLAGAASSQAQAINDLGHVVGFAQTSVVGNWRATLYANSTVYDLNSMFSSFLVSPVGNTAGFTSLDIVYDINNTGRIVGRGTYRTETGTLRTEAFMASYSTNQTVSVSDSGPTIWLFMVGLGTVWLVRRVRVNHANGRG